MRKMVEELESRRLLTAPPSPLIEWIEVDAAHINIHISQAAGSGISDNGTILSSNSNWTTAYPSQPECGSTSFTIQLNTNSFNGGDTVTIEEAATNTLDFPQSHSATVSRTIRVPSIDNGVTGLYYSTDVGGIPTISN